MGMGVVPAASTDLFSELLSVLSISKNRRGAVGAKLE